MSWVSVKDFGALGDGVTDDTLAINACLAANLRVFFPEPLTFYKITAPLNLRSGHYLMGSSRTPNKGLHFFSPATDALFASVHTGGTRDIIIENIYLFDAVRSSRSAGHGIHIDGAGDAATVTIRDTMVYGFQDGINVTALMKSLFENNRQTSSLRDAWHCQLTSTSTHVSTNYADAPGRYGYYATILNYSEFQACACDQAASDSYHFEMGDGGVSRNVTFISCGLEQGKGNGWYLDGTSFVLINPSITSIPTGTGKAGILLNGAGLTIIMNPRVVGADWAVSMPIAPLHIPAKYAKSNVVTSIYADSQGVGVYNDPLNLLVHV